MNPAVMALGSLSRAGYSVYNPILQDEGCFVIENSYGVLHKVLLRKASHTGKTPVLTLNLKQQTKSYLQKFGFLLVIELESDRVWLLPIDEIPSGIKAIRLGEKYEPFILKPIEKATMLDTSGLKRMVEQRVASEKVITQDVLEHLLTSE